MKTNLWAVVFCGFGLLCFSACKRSQAPVGPPQEFYGAKLEWAKLDPAFADAPEQTKATVALADRAFRYAQFPQGLEALDKLSNDPSLNEPQKKLVNDLIEQTKQVIAKAPPPPGQ